MIYDYVVPISELASKKKYDKLKFCINELAGKLQVFDLILFCRQLNTNISLPPESYTFLLHLVLLLLELMTDGTICGVNTNTGEVFVDNSFPTFFEVLLVLVLDCSSKATLINKQGHRKLDIEKHRNAYNFVKLKYEDFQDKWESTIKTRSNIDVNLYSEKEIEALNIKLLGNVLQSGAIHCNSLLFNNTFEYSTVLDCAYWEREDLTNPENCSTLFLSAILQPTFSHTTTHFLIEKF